VKFKIPFEIKTSHNIEEFEFKGDNEIKLELINDCFLLNYKDKEYEIKVQDNDNFYFEIECDVNDINTLCDTLESFFSYFIDNDNLNRHYGNYFIKIDRFNIKIISNDRGIRDSLSIKSTTHKKIKFEAKYIINDFILQTYYEALKSPSAKLKYFNLFLILEYIENSNLYKKMFLNDENYLFNKGDFEKCKKLFNGKQLNRLKQLENNKSFTKQSRRDKLYSILDELEVLEINVIQGKIKLTQQDIKEIIENRNKIFHSSQSSNFESILWFKLFPLCENIVNKSFKGELCIEK